MRLVCPGGINSRIVMLRVEERILDIVNNRIRNLTILIIYSRRILDILTKYNDSRKIRKQ
jgi:hypothetical protein